MSRPYSAEELEERLEEHIDAALSSRRTAQDPAQRLSAHSRADQEFVLHWVAAVSKTNSEMGYQVARHASDALRQLDLEATEAWILSAMDGFDREGLTVGIARIRDLEQFVSDHRERGHTLALDQVHRVLEGLVHGLSGRALKLEAGERVYTDTETLYLPAILRRFDSERANFDLYKAMVAHLWAQCWYGTWRDLRGFEWERFPDPERAITLFHRLETLRLDARIAADLPGVGRLQQSLRLRLEDEPVPDSWRAANEVLSAPEATARDSLYWVDRLIESPLPAPCCYQGVLRPEAVDAILQLRLDREKEEFRQALAVLQEEAGDTAQPSGTFALTPGEPAMQDHPPMTLQFDDRPVEPPADVTRLMSSIHQDLGEIPDEYLVPAGPGEYDARARVQSAEDVWKGTYHEEGAYHYREWDYVRGSYRKDWCVLREREVHPKFDGFAQRTLKKYHGLAQSLCRTFEVIRGAPGVLRGEPYGEDVDLDALVRAVAEARAGREMTQRVFTRQARNERNIAVMFMVDMSGSTKGWVNEVEREALILLCEALQRLQDQYAIYGFSGITRKRCELFSIKRFDESYDETVAARISGILPQDYTRMGVAIRHLSEQLQQVEARSRLLITLSDGRPEDYTDYRGEYGIEDTRHALFEARRSGIHPFCITIDEEGREYLPHMYGPANYAVVSDIRRLPSQVSDIYRRLTT